MTIDFTRIRAEYRLSEIAAKSIKLDRDGDEFRGLCPFHQEKTPSFTINDAKRFYHCFGCGAHGDVIDFVADIYQRSTVDAVKMLTGETFEKAKPRKLLSEPAAGDDVYHNQKPGEGVAELPVAGRPIRLFNKKRSTFVTHTPSLVHPYRSASGELLGCVIRLDLDDGQKITPQIRWGYVSPKVPGMWVYWPFDVPRPLYVLKPDKSASDQVLVVEGEKAADAAYRVIGDMAVVTWPGGVNAVSKAAWARLKGKRLVLWPDNDAPGIAAMAGHRGKTGLWIDGVADLALRAGATSVKIVEPDASKSKGWDAADAEAEGWDRKKLLTWAAGRAKPFVAQATPSSESEPVSTPAVSGKASGRSSDKAPTSPAVPKSAAPAPDFPFDCVGYNEDASRYFIRARDTQAVMSFTAPQLATASGLLSLYSNEAFWENDFPAKGKSSIDVTQAATAIMAECKKSGMFQVARMRGLGAWLDEGRTIINIGSNALVDGTPTRLSDIVSRNVYLRRDEIEVGAAQPATLAQAQQLLRICGALNWEETLSGRLLAGWIVSAAVCGVLTWRPHIWITGAAGSGKSSVIEHIMKPMLGELAVICDGHTTEAGIRQKLRNDARALFVDEFESRPNEVGDRVQSVLDLLRGASSGVQIVKGSASGEPITFVIRTQACLSSINPGVREKADEDRVSKLTLLRNERPDAQAQWAELQAKIVKTITPQYAAAMFSRTVAMIDVFRKNVEVFRFVGTRVLGSQRHGDQIAPMCAGAWLCYSDDPVTEERAEAWVREKSWDAHTSVSTEEDWVSLLNHLSNCQLGIAYRGGSTRRIPIEELIRWEASNQPMNDKGDVELADMSEVRRQLRVHGIAVHGSTVFVANKNSNLQRLFASTQWFKGWQPTLKRVPGAVLTLPRAFRADGGNTRGIELPLSTFLPSASLSEPTQGYDGSSDTIEETFGD